MERYCFRKLFLTFLILVSLQSCAANISPSLPDGFVYIEQMIPDITTEIRYYTGHNFVGERINGYLKPRCILTRDATDQLKKVQIELRKSGLGLKIFDAYRPQKAVDHFVLWAKDHNDIKMKTEFYPNVKKENLFKEGYIASKSSHSRGSTVDLTIISLKTHKALDMGSNYDFFGPASWLNYPDITPLQRSNRNLLRSLMTKYGFNPYPQEWWHFTLKNEPFPDTYFDFPVQ